MRRVKAKHLNNLPKNIFIGKFRSLLDEVLQYVKRGERVIFDMSGITFPKLSTGEWLEMWKPLRITQDSTYGEYPSHRREGSGNYLPPMGIDFEALNIIPIFRKAVFEGDANFSNVKFPDFTDFSLTLFKGRACFRMTEFGDMTTFKGAIFADEANFTWAHFGFNVNMQRMKFMGNRITFERASFEDKASFYKSIVFVPIYFWDVHNLFPCHENRNTLDECSQRIKIRSVINEIKSKNEQMMEISFKDAIFGKGVDLEDFTIFFFGRYQPEGKLRMFQEGKSLDIALAKGFISDTKKNLDLGKIFSDLLFVATIESENPNINILKGKILLKDEIYLGKEKDGNENNKFYFVLWVPDVNISFQGVQKDDDFLIELRVVYNMNNGLLNADLLPSIIVLNKKELVNLMKNAKGHKNDLKNLIKKLKDRIQNYSKCIENNLKNLQERQKCESVLRGCRSKFKNFKENNRNVQFFRIIKIVETKAVSEIEENTLLKIVSLDFMDSILRHGKLTVKAHYYNKTPCINNKPQKLEDDIEKYIEEIVRIESKDKNTEMDINKFSSKIRIKLSIYNSTIRDYVVVGGLIHDLLIEKNIIMAPLEIKPLKGEG